MSSSGEKLVSEFLQVSVNSITLRRVCVPLLEPFRISNGEASVKESILVEVKAKGGITGWGESSPMSGSFYSDETPETAFRALKEKLLPLIFAEKEIDVSHFYKELRSIPGEAFAKAGLEGALWDAAAKQAGKPLCQMLGGGAANIASGVALGIYDTVEELLERVRLYSAQGYRRIKIKVQPGWDLEPVRAVRENFPETPLMVDANAAYTLEHANIFRELDEYGLMMIEQPLAATAFDEAAELQKILKTPICADESAESLESLELLIRKNAARVINIKIQRVGGLSEAILMLQRARSAGLKCWVGTMPELGVASAQGLHFASLGGFSYPTDIEASARWFADDIIEPQIEIDNEGFIQIAEGAGNGFEVSLEKVERYAVASETFKA